MNMAILAESAVRVTLLAFGVAVVLRALRIRSPRLAHTAWTVVTVVMLLLPVFVAWGPRLAVPLLHTGTTPATFAPGGSDVASAKPEDGPMTAAASEGSQPGMSWATLAMVVYVGGVGILLLRLAMGLRRTRAMRRGGLQTKGRLTHPDCVTPMTVGLVAPAVILPTDWANWDGAELSAVLAHEEEHVRRRDPFVTAVALFNRAIFWFHPLAWWLPREMVRLSEDRKS